MYFNRYQDFPIETFEYRILNEISFRHMMTQTIEGEQLYDPNAVHDPNRPPEAPTVVEKQQNQQRAAGEDVTFQALLSGNPRPRVIWFKDGQRLMPSQRCDISVLDNIATLVLRSVSAHDSGYYTLYSENPKGFAIHSVFLNVDTSSITSSRPQTTEPQYRPNIYQ